jgi:hypothetical protein
MKIQARFACLLVAISAITPPFAQRAAGYPINQIADYLGCSQDLPRSTCAPQRNVVSVQLTDVGGWRVVRTPGQKLGADVVSVMHTADLLHSDPHFAGIMIRCRDNAALQVGVIVLQPFPPRANPLVSVTSGNSTVRFKAEILPTGSILSLPDEAAALVSGPWQQARQVSFIVEDTGVKIRGAVPTDNLSAALALLRSNCASQ